MIWKITEKRYATVKHINGFSLFIKLLVSFYDFKMFLLCIKNPKKKQRLLIKKN